MLPTALRPMCADTRQGSCAMTCMMVITARNTLLRCYMCTVKPHHSQNADDTNKMVTAGPPRITRIRTAGIGLWAAHLPLLHSLPVSPVVAGVVALSGLVIMRDKWPQEQRPNKPS